MRGRGRPISTVLADALGGDRRALPALLAAVFAEVCGWPLSREVALRGVTRDGRLIAVASGRPWAEQVERLAPTLCRRINARVGREVVSALEVRVGPLGR
jgi:hypothetical protein